MTKHKYIALFTLICAIVDLNAMEQFFNTLDLKRSLPMAIVPLGMPMANRFIYNEREAIISNGQTCHHSSTIMQNKKWEEPGSVRPYLKTAAAGTILNILFSNMLFSECSTWTSIGLGALTSIPIWASSAYYCNKERRLFTKKINDEEHDNDVENKKNEILSGFWTLFRATINTNSDLNNLD